MNESEKQKNEATESSKKRIKKSKPITSVKPLDSKDHNILNDYKNGVVMNIICARYMVHRTYVESLVEKYK